MTLPASYALRTGLRMTLWSTCAPPSSSRGGIDDALDRADFVGRKSALAGVLADRVLVGRNVDAVHLVRRDEDFHPLDLRPMLRSTLQDFAQSPAVPGRSDCRRRESRARRLFAYRNSDSTDCWPELACARAAMEVCCRMLYLAISATVLGMSVARMPSSAELKFCT